MATGAKLCVKMGQHLSLLGLLAVLRPTEGDAGRHLHSLLEFCKHDGIMEEEQVSGLGPGAYADLNTLIQQQLSVLAGQAKDEWTLLRSHPAGGFLPKTPGIGMVYTLHNAKKEKEII